MEYVSIHAPVQAGDQRWGGCNRRPCVSIHAPVQAGDQRWGGCNRRPCEFQSTPPYKRATQVSKLIKWYIELFQSTPPYKRATCTPCQQSSTDTGFNPRPRTSGRPHLLNNQLLIHLFQSTPPYKRATPERRGESVPGMVSIHAPVQAGDNIQRAIDGMC